MKHAENENYKVTKAVHEGILADDVNTGRPQRNILLSMKRLYMKVSLL